MCVPRRLQPGLPHEGLVAARGRLELGISYILVEFVVGQYAREDGDRGQPIADAVHMPTRLKGVPQLLVDLLADLAGQASEKGRCELKVCGGGVVGPVLFLPLLLPLLLLMPLLRHLLQR